MPQLEVATRFAQNTFKLSLQLASIRDLKRLPELDDQGVIQVNNYVQKLIKDVRMAAQTALDSAAEMMHIFGDLSTSDYSNHPNMVESFRALREMSKYITPAPNPQGKITLEPKTIFEWAEKLDEGRKYAIIAYLFWASDIISGSKSEGKKIRPN